ncbi:MAG: alpha/beta hydrolase, partial [Actinomycetota bacterium]
RHPQPDEVIERLSEPGALTAALNWYRANSRPETMLAPGRPLPHFTQPTLGIWGSDDPHLVEEFVTHTADYVDNTWRYERIEQAGHWIQLDQPEALSSLLIDYLRSHQPTGS